MTGAPAGSSEASGGGDGLGVESDRRTVRRGLGAGLIAGLLVGTPLLIAVLVGDGGAWAAYVVVVLAALVGAAVAAVWLLAAAALDLFSGQPISRRRALWTFAACLATLMMPLLWLLGDVRGTS